MDTIKTISALLAIGIRCFAPDTSHRAEWNLIFWVAALTWGSCISFKSSTAKTWRWMGQFGALCNAVVTIANHGFMPFVPIYSVSKSHGWWVTVTADTRLLFLADINWASSVGDMFLVSSVAGIFAVWLLNKLQSRNAVAVARYA